MSSKILQSQRIASLLLKELPEFVGDLQAGHAEGWAARRASCLGRAPRAGHTGRHRQRWRFPELCRQWEGGGKRGSALHTSPPALQQRHCRGMRRRDTTGSVWWKDSLCLRNIPEYSSLKNNEQRGDLRKPATFQLMTVFAGSAKKEQWLLLPRDYQCWPLPSQTWKQS